MQYILCKNDIFFFNFLIFLFLFLKSKKTKTHKSQMRYILDMVSIEFDFENK